MRSESDAIAAILSGERTLDDYGTSTSEWLTLCLALNRHDQLDGTGYDTPKAAYNRLESERAIVRATERAQAIQSGIDEELVDAALAFFYRADGSSEPGR